MMSRSSSGCLLSGSALTWLLVSACGGADPVSPGARVPIVPSGTPAATTAGSASLPPATLPPSTQVPGSVGSAGAPAIPPPVTAAGGAPAPAAVGGVPCDVAKTVSDKCTLCHAATPRFSAPMPLMTLQDFTAPSRSNPAMPVYKIVPTRIHATDTARLMPPVGSDALSAPELKSFGDWLDAGAQPSANACPITEKPATPTEGPAPTKGGSGGASIDPIEYDDPDMKCYKFLVHAQGDFDKPYMQGPGEQYMNFTFKAPWTGTMYSRAIKLAIDPNSKVLHHWLLFKDTSLKQDGAVEAGIGTHPDGVLLHGWAPGATPIYLDPDTGMKLEGNVTYTLEAHLNNPGATAGGDHSGAEVCVTSKVPTHVVDVSWVGTDSINGTSASGRCTPSGSDPIHIIAAQPHMHTKGRHMKVVVNRKGGMAETIHDKDFSFDDQRYYILDTVLMPGDTMSTSCTYSAPSTFGSSTNQEMCYFFSLHWPGGRLGSSSLIHGANTCLN